MATSKITTGNDVINGLVTVFRGNAAPASYDNTQRTQHFTNPTGVTVLDTINSRYLRHGGAGGSGAWEH